MEKVLFLVMMSLVMVFMLWVPSLPPKVEPPPPPPLTETQAAWVRDVCVPNAMRSEFNQYAVLKCQRNARLLFEE